MKVLNCIFAFVVFSILIVIGFSFIYFALSHIWFVHQSQNWASTSGQIISSRVSAVSHKGTVYTPDIIYRYMVDGVAYEGNKVSYGFGDGNSSSAQEKVAQYPINSKVQVFCNSASPNESCLEVGGSTLGFSLPILAGSIFSIIGIWGIYRNAKPKRREYYVGRKRLWN